MIGSEPAIDVSAVSKRFGRTLALDEVDVAVSPGELFALVGPNGAGKSTLVDILCTVARPDSGTVRIAGVDALRRPVEARKRLGVVFQSSTLDGRLSVNENLDFHARVYGMASPDRRRRRADVLGLIGLPEIGERIVRTLSQGTRRRLEIARAIMHQPAILLLDEPTVGLDAQSRAALWEHLDAIRKANGVTLVVTTHYLAEVENSTTVCIIDKGRVLASGSPSALKADHAQKSGLGQPSLETVFLELIGRTLSDEDTAPPRPSASALR
jgi:ABC-2 type transport system ATP-binding protein